VHPLALLTMTLAQATQQALLYTTTYPIGALDTITLTADFADEILTDDRQDTNTARPITLLTAVQENSGTATGASKIALATGTSGFWGLGVYQVRPAKSASLMGLLTGNIGQQGRIDYTRRTWGYRFRRPK